MFPWSLSLADWAGQSVGSLTPHPLSGTKHHALVPSSNMWGHPLLGLGIQAPRNRSVLALRELATSRRSRGQGQTVIISCEPLAAKVHEGHVVGSGLPLRQVVGGPPQAVTQELKGRGKLVDCAKGVETVVAHKALRAQAHSL